MFGGGVPLLFCSLYTFPIYTEPLRQEGLFLYRSAALWLWGFLVCLCWRGLWAPFDPVLGLPKGEFADFWGFLEVFWRFFSTHKTHWLGSLVFVRVFETLSRSFLWSTSPYFGLQGRLGVCIVVWVAAARRKKRRTSSVFLLVRSGWMTFNCIVFWFLTWRKSDLPVGDVGGV